MINLDDITNENNKEHNEKWPYIPDHPYRILIIGASGSRKTNALLNLIKEQDNFKVMDKVYLYAKDLSKPKYKFLIKKFQNTGTKHLKNPNAFIECSNTMDDVYENINGYNPSRKRKTLIVFDDMIADIITNKKFQATIKELFIRCTKINISLVFIGQSYFSVPKDSRLNSIHFLIMNINSRKELQNIANNSSADIDYKDLMKIYREWTKEPYSFLTTDTMLTASNPLRFRKKFVSFLIKMTATDQIKILDGKVMQNEAQYDLDRKAAKMSALSSNNLDKYEYLTGEDLGLKPSTGEQAKLKYSPLGKVFTKGLDDKDDKKKDFLRG